MWEYVTDQLGAQGTVLAGGRYSALVSLLGGPTDVSVRLETKGVKKASSGRTQTVDKKIDFRARVATRLGVGFRMRRTLFCQDIRHLRIVVARLVSALLDHLSGLTYICL